MNTYNSDRHIKGNVKLGERKIYDICLLQMNQLWWNILLFWRLRAPFWIIMQIDPHIFDVGQKNKILTMNWSTKSSGIEFLPSRLMPKIPV